MPYLAGFVTPQDYGADPTGTTDSTTAFNDALAAQLAGGGGIVAVPWGQYMVSGISMPPYTELLSLSTPITLNEFSSSTGIARIFANPSWSPGSTTGIVNFQSKTPGGWSVEAASSGLKNVFIDGSTNASTNIQGIAFTGPVYDTTLEDVFIWKAGHNGVSFTTYTESGITPTSAYHQRWRRVTAADCGNIGFPVSNVTDSNFGECLAFGNTAAGWSISNCSNSLWTACRSEWNEYGFAFSGSAGSMAFSGCTTDQNSREGVYVNAATATTAQGGGIIWSGGKCHADANGAVSGHTFGVNVSGATVPVIISGLNVESGEDVNNSNYYPATALNIATSSHVMVSGSMLQGISASWAWDSAGTVGRSGCMGATGNPGSQTFTRLTDI